MTYHEFSTDLDGEVMRCDNCGMNVLHKIRTCEEYTEYNRARNEALRAKITNS
jgi:DNA-directed RNA polymerase subunit RPC12/RpoP